MGDFFDYDEDEMDGEVYNVAQRKTRDQIPGYTGHVHKLRETFGTTYSNASRVALQCPPDSPEPMSQWDQSRGTRVMTASGYNLPGSGFTAMAIPNETQKGDRVYVQGSSVDLAGYYKTLEANEYQQVLIKSGSPKKAKSHLIMGDNFYYSGQHVWETTYQETFKEGPVMAALSNGGASAESSGIPVMPGTEGQEEDEVNFDEATYRYRVIQAVVGKKRLDDLEDQIRAKVTARMAGGAGELLKSFKLFSSGQGEIGPTQMMSVIQDLGVDINRREAYALFGRFDINKDGGIVYYEFVDALLQKDEGIQRDATYYDRR
uniref:EF-hand domain-containing protein n=1 Tax=Hemiselmis andersenii TaxID=464988 RepID=A0A6U4UY24_HEMAN|mmetsp:Transcript_19106/g.44023  ORF Transcript_19106/g.44023 Transcript_19106/m.44023 type:complete len:318 (+) Transcript_19106:199-1152(+)